MKFGRKSFAKPKRRGCDDHPLDYKDVDYLKKFLGPHGQVQGTRRTGYITKCQRELKQAVKRARHLGLLPYVG